MTQGNVYDALRFMLGRDTDWATQHNKIGFNGVDTEFAHSLGDQLYRDGLLTDKQVAALRKILRKYVASQLGDNFDLDADVPTKQSITRKSTTVSDSSSKRISMSKDAQGVKILCVKFPYDLDLVNKVKEIRGRRWNPTARQWELPYNAESFQELQDRFGGEGFSVDKAIVADLAKDIEAVQEIKTLSTAPELDEALTIQGLGGALYPFQEVGVKFVQAVKGRALLADEMGLGKTIQALAYLQSLGHNAVSRVLVVCPATLKFNWALEAERWLDKDWKVTIIHDGSIAIPPDGVVIISYALASRRTEELVAWKPEFVVLDECHYIKNRKAQRSKAAAGFNTRVGGLWVRTKGYAESAKHLLCLSGTPFLNRPLEMFPTLQLIDRKKWGKSWFQFAQRYTNVTNNGFGHQYEGVRNVDELRDRLATTMVRRVKKDVLPDLPDKTWALLPVEITNMANYAGAEADIIRWLMENEGPEAAKRGKRAKFLVKLNKLYELVGKGKAVPATQWAVDFLESTDQKLVIFAHHIEVVNLISRGLNDAGYKFTTLTGSTPDKQRQQVVESFQENPDIRVLIISKAGGLGLNLTAASNLLFTERLWNPAQESQVEDRTHRIGQENKVTIWQMAAHGTIDEYFAQLVEEKRALFDAVFAGKESLETELIDNVIDYLWERKEDAKCK